MRPNTLFTLSIEMFFYGSVKHVDHFPPEAITLCLDTDLINVIGATGEDRTTGYDKLIDRPRNCPASVTLKVLITVLANLLMIFSF